MIEGCDQDTLTGATFTHLQGIQALGMFCCNDDQVATARSLGLRVNTQPFLLLGGLHFYLEDSEDDE